MRVLVGVTDSDWYRQLMAQPDVDEINFWQPSPVPIRSLDPGELFLFKLHGRSAIVGGGVFAHWSHVPVSMAWDTFREKNGVESLADMRRRLARYRRTPEDPRADYEVGCILLEQPFFLKEEDWIPAPLDWSPNIVRAKGYDTTKGEGRRIWDALVANAPLAAARMKLDQPVPVAVFETRSTVPALIYPRLGQGTFRVLVTDIYQRRCVMTGERTLPVLQAAHIKSIPAGGPHDPRNGLLLRSDLHTLFDRGYMTVTPDLRIDVSRRIRDEFENGRDYYALAGRPIAEPTNRACLPSTEYLDWHSRNVFRG